MGIRQSLASEFSSSLGFSLPCSRVLSEGVGKKCVCMCVGGGLAGGRAWQAASGRRAAGGQHRLLDAGRAHLPLHGCVAHALHACRRMGREGEGVQLVSQQHGVSMGAMGLPEAPERKPSAPSFLHVQQTATENKCAPPAMAMS